MTALELFDAEIVDAELVDDTPVDGVRRLRDYHWQEFKRAYTAARTDGPASQVSEIRKLDALLWRLRRIEESA